MGAGRGLHLGHWFDKKTNRFTAERYVYEDDRHALLFGPTRSGKFTRLLAVNLLSDCLDDRSVIVIDPKGEAAAVTAWHRFKTLGHDVKILDPLGVLYEAVKDSPEHRQMISAGLAHGVGFEPLDALDPGTPEKPSRTFYDEAMQLGDALIRIDPNERDKHWPESAQALTVGCLMWEKLFRGEAANLENVRVMLTAPNLGAVAETVAQCASHEMFLQRGGKQIKSLLARFQKDTGEVASIRSAADTQTRWMLSDAMEQSFKAPERINFRALRERPTTVYVILPADYLRSHSVWLRLVIVSALRALYRPGGVRVTMLIDELFALGHLGALEDAFSLVGGYAVQIMGIMQNLSQLKGLYKDQWETFLANAGVKQFFAPDDPATAEWMTKRGGATTKWAESMGETGSEEGKRESKNWNQVRVDRFRSHDLFGLKPGEGLAWLAGVSDTVQFMAPNYWELRRCAARALPNPYAPGFRR